MTLVGTSNPRRARHVAPLAVGLVLVLVAVACLLAGHEHLAGFDPGKRTASDAHPGHGLGKAGCSICSLAHHDSVAVEAPRGAFVENREIDSKSQRQLPFGAVPIADEQAPRAPPRSAIG